MNYFDCNRADQPGPSALTIARARSAKPPSLTAAHVDGIDFHGVRENLMCALLWYVLLAMQGPVMYLLYDPGREPSSSPSPLPPRSSTARFAAIAITIDRMHFRMYGIFTASDHPFGGGASRDSNAENIEFSVFLFIFIFVKYIIFGSNIGFK